ncbi:MAG: hypothetical protein K2X46_07515 [Roseomonas sp.]|nr:hypothetical protein [Roseomonas sp.]
MPDAWCQKAQTQSDLWSTVTNTNSAHPDDCGQGRTFHMENFISSSAIRIHSELYNVFFIQEIFSTINKINFCQEIKSYSTKIYQEQPIKVQTFPWDAQLKIQENTTPRSLAPVCTPDIPGISTTNTDATRHLPAHQRCSDHAPGVGVITHAGEAAGPHSINAHEGPGQC